MRTFSYKFMLCLGLTALLASCSKEFLETQPTDRIAEETAFVSIDNAQKSLNGIYRLLYSQFGNQHRDGQGAVMIITDAMGDDYVRTKSGYSYFRNAYQWVDHRNETSTNVTLFVYRFYYIIISNANMIIANIDDLEGAEADKKRIKGEALALRGWAHFQLVQYYAKRYDASAVPNSQAGVPILITTTTEGQPRATVEAVYEQVNADLDEAITLLGEASTRSNKTHVNLQVAKGFKARVALTMQDWATAAQYAREAREGFASETGQSDALMTNAQYLEGFSNISNPEWIWGISQLSDQVPTYGSFYGYMSANYNSSFTRTNPKCINSLLYAQIPSTDIRKQLWWDGTTANKVNFPGVLDASTGQSVSSQTYVKYQHRKYLVPDYSTRAGDIPYMRTAEMYLIEAEAEAEAGNDATAAQVLYTLAHNRDGGYTLSTNTGQDLVAEIWLQRRMELWGEGFRFTDLKRTDSPLDRTNSNHNSDLAKVLSVPAGDVRWQFMIPQDEINSNPAITAADQNP